jgi:hypothetical protein
VRHSGACSGPEKAAPDEAHFSSEAHFRRRGRTRARSRSPNTLLAELWRWPNTVAELATWTRRQTPGWCDFLSITERFFSLALTARNISGCSWTSLMQSCEKILSSPSGVDKPITTRLAARLTGSRCRHERSKSLFSTSSCPPGSYCNRGSLLEACCQKRIYGITVTGSDEMYAKRAGSDEIFVRHWGHPNGDYLLPCFCEVGKNSSVVRIVWTPRARDTLGARQAANASIGTGRVRVFQWPRIQ